MSPGLLHVRTNITSPALTPTTYNTWYDTIHIPELCLIPGGPKQAHRYRATDPASQKWNFLALYPLDDIAFTSDPKIKEKVSPHHPILPEGKPIWELVELEGRDYIAVGKHGFLESKSRFIFAVEIDVRNEDGEILEKRLNEHLPMLECRRYKIHRSPTAITGEHNAEVHAPRELLIYGLDSKEDIERVAQSLLEALDDLRVELEWESWEAI